MKNTVKCILKILSALAVLAAAIWACVTYWDKISAFFRTVRERLARICPCCRSEYADYDEKWGISL